MLCVVNTCILSICDYTCCTVCTYIIYIYIYIWWCAWNNHEQKIDVTQCHQAGDRHVVVIVLWVTGTQHDSVFPLCNESICVVLDSHCIALGICLLLTCPATGLKRTFSPTFALIQKRPNHFQLTVCEIMRFQGHVWDLGICSRPFRNLVPQNCGLIWFGNLHGVVVSGFWFARELQFATLDVFQISAQSSGQICNDSWNFKIVCWD